MRQFILTQNNNNLHYMASTPACGFAFPANEFVDLAVTYKDSFHTPLAGRNLVWQLAEGEATLRHQATPVGSDGNGVNSIQVTLADPSANATIRLAVWPEDEPESKLEFECLFGAPKSAPPIGAGNWLKILYPGDDPKYLAPISLAPDAGDINYLVFYADPYGIPIESKEIIITSALGRSTISNNTKIRLGQFYTHFKEVDQYSPGEWITTAKVDGKEDNSKNLLIDQNIVINQVINFWPINNSVLYPGYSYDLKTLHTAGNGFVLSRREILWSVNTRLPDGVEVRIEPASLKEDHIGTAISSITVPYVVYGMDDRITLKVGLVGMEESDIVIFDYPTFKIGGPRFVQVAPLPDNENIFDPHNSYAFQVKVTDENGIAPSGNFSVTWEASVKGEGEARFPELITELQNGLSQSDIHFSNMPQGVVQNIDVTITPSEGAPYKASYQVAANVIAPVSPTTTDPLAVGIEQAVKVSVTDYKGNAVRYRTLNIAPNSDIKVGSSAATDFDGIATIPVTASAALTTQLSISEGPDCVPTTVKLTFGENKPKITIDQPDPQTIRYDTDVTVTATYTDSRGPVPSSQLKLDLTLADGSPVAPNLSWNPFANTDPSGKASFWFHLSTVSGPPAFDVSLKATVKTADGSVVSETALFTFTGPARHNNLKLLQPNNNSSQSLDTNTIIIVELSTESGKKLNNYPIKWNLPTDGVTIKRQDELTRSYGTAIAIIEVTKAQSLPFTVEATQADATCPIQLNFGVDDYQGTALAHNKRYAHNPPRRQDVDPLDESQIITYTYTYVKNGIPQPGKLIDWTVETMMPGMQFFDEKNTELFVDNDAHIIPTKTDQNGKTILKIGSLTACVATVRAWPNENNEALVQSSEFVIATFLDVTYYDQFHQVEYEPQPIDLTGKYAYDHDGFTLQVPPGSVGEEYKKVVFWINSRTADNSQENIVITSYEEAVDGSVVVPFKYLTPDIDGQPSNIFSYMLVNTTGAGFQTRPVLPEVISSAPNHPAPGVTRTLAAPYLRQHASIINFPDIVDGLDIFVDIDSDKTLIGKTITLILYLNKKGGGYGNRLQQRRKIAGSDINNKQLVFNFAFDDVKGYDKGTLESDYNIDDTWSKAFGPIEIDTVEP